MTNEEIQKELAATLELSTKVYRMNAPEEKQYLIDYINELSMDAKEKVHEEYKNAEGPVKNIRKAVAQRILTQKLTIEYVQSLIDEQKLIKASSFKQYKSFFSILYPIALNSENDARYAFFSKILFPKIQSVLGIEEHTKVAYFDFGGERQYGSTRIWFAIYNNLHTKQDTAKQLFFNLENGKIKVNLNDHLNRTSKYEKIFNSIDEFSFEELISIYEKGKKEVLEDKPKEIFLNGNKLYKISHSDHLKKKKYQTVLQKLKENKWITLHDEGGTQEKEFKHKLSVGDYVYITKGNDELFEIAKVVSPNWYPLPDGFWEENNWIYREVEYIKEPINKRYKVSSTEVIYPRGQSTFKEIRPEKLNEANSKLFQPAYNVLFKLGTSNENQQEMIDTPKNNNHPLNTILFGPPGTGKTYSTIDLTAKILDFDTGNHEQNLIEFNKRLGEQIEFVTFHQSFSYEDFIEGIKPKIASNKSKEKSVIYDIESGIFKNIALKATQSASRKETKITFEEVFEELRNDWITSENDEVEIPMPRVSFHITDIGNSSIAFRKNSGGTAHTLSINTLKRIYEGETEYISGGLGVYYNPLVKYLKDKSSSLDTSNLITPIAQNYVLIIDEINRGNVSSIFGELITLIEKDKRAGGKNPMKLKLPYSKDDFSVPSNLYIIGTMNTADRSVEALDTALRRRFSFVEVIPDPALITAQKLDLGDKLSGINPEKLLKTINQRIRKLIDKDHMIGHAYFMELKDAENPLEHLREIFQNKILPLLQEYFYGNFGKIQLVLGKAFIKKVEDEDVSFAEADIDDYDLAERTVYEIKDVLNKSILSDEDFIQAVKKIYE